MEKGRFSACCPVIGKQVGSGTLFEELTAQNELFLLVPTFVWLVGLLRTGFEFANRSEVFYKKRKTWSRNQVYLCYKISGSACGSRTSALSNYLPCAQR